MKKNILYLFAIFFLFSFQTNYSYWWRFNNFSTNALIIKLTLHGSKNSYYAIVKPEESTLFDWSMPHIFAGFCLKKIEWAVISKTVLSTLDLYNHNVHEIESKTIAQLVLDNPTIVMNTAKIHYISTELYEKTVNAAEKLGPKKFIRGIAQLYVESACKSRQIFIIEDLHKQIYFFAQKD